jgi:hypothetical protein
VAVVIVRIKNNNIVFCCGSPAAGGCVAAVPRTPLCSFVGLLAFLFYILLLDEARS